MTRHLVWLVAHLAVLLPLVSSLSSPQPTRREAFMGAVTVATSPALLSPTQALDLAQYQDGPRGLKYLVTKEGNPDGAKPERAQKVKTSYTLCLKGFAEDGGTKVDSSKGLLGDKPFEFYVGVSQVIKGWDLALLDMKEGEARRLIVPSDLRYGDKGAGASIPGGATLYLEVELTEIGKKPTLGPDQVKWLEEHPL